MVWLVDILQVLVHKNMGHKYVSIVPLFIYLNCSQTRCFHRQPCLCHLDPWLLNVHIPVHRTKPGFTPHSRSWRLLQGKWSRTKNYILGVQIKSETLLHEINPNSHLKEQNCSTWWLSKCLTDTVNHTLQRAKFLRAGLSRITELVCFLQPPLASGSPLVSSHILNNQTE